MKITIESELLNATTDSLSIARSLLALLDAPVQHEGAGTDKTPSALVEDIPASKYLTITTKGIKCGGKWTKTYNGNDIRGAKDAVDYFTDSILLFKEESGLDVTELHVLQSSTSGTYAAPGDPAADPEGVYCWCRIKTADGKLSRWVFLGAISSVADCRSICAYLCGYDVRSTSGMRAGVFGSVGA